MASHCTFLMVDICFSFGHNFLWYHIHGIYTRTIYHVKGYGILCEHNKIRCCTVTRPSYEPFTDRSMDAPQTSAAPTLLSLRLPRPFLLYLYVSRFHLVPASVNHRPAVWVSLACCRCSSRFTANDICPSLRGRPSPLMHTSGCIAVHTDVLPSWRWAGLHISMFPGRSSGI
jgi:hypothetical protein